MEYDFNEHDINLLLEEIRKLRAAIIKMRSAENMTAVWYIADSVLGKNNGP